MSIPPAGSDIPAAVSQDDKTMAIIAYVGGAFVSFLVPLIIYMIKKDQSRFVAFHALQALFFHLAILVGYAIGGALAFVLIGFVVIPIVGILSLVFSILAALAASRGEWYEIPLVGKFTRQQVGV